MNIAMEQTEEHVGGVMTNRYGDAFIRGNNGVLSPSVRCLALSLRASAYEVLYISAAESL
jgi:hypothetical protein